MISAEGTGPAARMRRVLRTAVVLSLAFIMVGCTRVLMDTPSVVAEGLADPFAHVPPDWRTGEIPVFVASGRAPSGKTDPAVFYTNERSREVRLGLATVELGAGMSWEELVRESRATRRDRRVKLEVVRYEEFGPLWSTAWPTNYVFRRDWDAPGVDREPAERFVRAIEARLQASRYRRIMIFVHGFNTNFIDNLLTTGEFWHYMSHDSVAISFDWASKGSLFSYHVDKANAEFAVRQFRELLEFLAANTSADSIDIIAHSAGNPVVVEAMRQISLMHYDLDDDAVRRQSKLGRVVLAAPDMDFDTTMGASVDGASRVAKVNAVYASRDDKALGFARRIFGDVRLGDSIGSLSEEKRKEVIDSDRNWIDSTAANRRFPSLLGHSYFHANPWVSSDVMLFLMFGATPEERGLVRDLETGFLVFPDDYAERLPEVVERLPKVVERLRQERDRSEQ